MDADELCPDCLGLGYIVTCIDDVCVGDDHCIHGDGEKPCETCEGEGFLVYSEIDDDERVDWEAIASEPDCGQEGDGGAT